MDSPQTQSNVPMPSGSTPPAPEVRPRSPKTSLSRVAAASFIGTTIEWYDFFIYGTAAALVFPHLFFPTQDPATGLLASYSTYAVAFFSRPVGAVVFGHFGDRIGRKRTLVSTLLIMGVATVLIGLLPGYDSGAFGLFEGGIGIWAAILLVLCRFFQGFAVGGEWAGATLLTAEYAPEGKRGMMAMWPQLGVAVAFFLSSGTFLIFAMLAGDNSQTDSAFMQYGWRIPFLLSAVLVIIGLWIRVSVEETPVFRKTQEHIANSPNRKLPFLDAIKYQWKEILLSSGALTSLFAFFFVATSFLTNYATTSLGHDRRLVLAVGMISAIVFGGAIALSAIYSDRIGRRKVIGISVALAVIWSPFIFPIVDSGSTIAFVIVSIVTLIIFGIAYGPVGALLPEMFQARYRYTGAALGYNLAGILGGALPALAITTLVTSGNSFGVGIMLALLSVLSLVCVVLLRESHDNKMDSGSNPKDTAVDQKVESL